MKRGDLGWMRSYEQHVADFWKKVNKNCTNGCWEWIGARTKLGYGRFRWMGKVEGASRIGYQIQIGPIPDGLNACHHCDNPPCVRGDHLFLGTQSENAIDCLNKNRRRIVRGEENGKSKLKEFEVLEIKRLIVNGLSIPDISRLTGFNPGTLWAIADGRSWRHINYPIVTNLPTLGPTPT